jgi:hypothetical protein
MLDVETVDTWTSSIASTVAEMARTALPSVVIEALGSLTSAHSEVPWPSLTRRTTCDTRDTKLMCLTLQASRRR